MGKRGRPPYPDILTPREWEVLDLLREGLSNPEIADRLGISRDGAKYHVSEILTKLGLSNREEAALWSASGGRERPWWAAALSPFEALWQRAGSVLPPKASAVALALSGALVVALVAGAALTAFLLLRSGDEKEARLTGTPLPGGEGQIPLRPDQAALFALNADGTALRQIVKDGDFMDMDLSPDGRQAAVLASTSEDGEALYIVDVETGERKEVLRDAFLPIRIGGWSPDGKWLALDGSTEADAFYPLQVYSLTDGSLRRLANERLRFVVWAPQSNAILVSDFSQEESVLQRVDLLTLQPSELLRGTGYLGTTEFSPDGQQLAVAVSGSESSTITLLRADGSDARPLLPLQPGDFASSLDWAPNGDRLAYVVGEGSSGGTYTLDIQTGASRRLTSPTEGTDTGAVWSPDGNRLLVSRYSCPGCATAQESGDFQSFTELVTVAADGSGEKVLPNTGHLQTAVGAWSPDGGSLLYGTDALYRADADGSNVEALSNIGAWSYPTIEWLPDGARALFVAQTAQKPVIYAVQPDGAGLSLLQAGFTSVAPDGESFALFAGGTGARGMLSVQWRDDDPFSAPAGIGHSFTWSPDSDAVAMVLGDFPSDFGLRAVEEGEELRSLGPAGPVSGPRWSPEGREIACWAQGGISIINADGGAMRSLAIAPMGTMIDWSPAGDEVAFVGEGSVVQAVQTDGDGTRTLFDASGLGVPPGSPYQGPLRWSPDGDHIALGEDATGNSSDAVLLIGSASTGQVVEVTQGWVSGMDWSPDGSQLAFGIRAGPLPAGIYLIDADGANLRQLTRATGRRHEVLRWLDDGRLAFLSSL